VPRRWPIVSACTSGSGDACPHGLGQSVRCDCERAAPKERTPPDRAGVRRDRQYVSAVVYAKAASSRCGAAPFAAHPFGVAQDRRSRAAPPPALWKKASLRGHLSDSSRMALRGPQDDSHAPATPVFSNRKLLCGHGFAPVTPSAPSQRRFSACQALLLGGSPRARPRRTAENGGGLADG